MHFNHSLLLLVLVALLQAAPAPLVVPACGEVGGISCKETIKVAAKDVATKSARAATKVAEDRVNAAMGSDENIEYLNGLIQKAGARREAPAVQEDEGAECGKLCQAKKVFTSALRELKALIQEEAVKALTDPENQKALIDKGKAAYNLGVYGV